jgi:hypothetical protein
MAQGIKMQNTIAKSEVIILYDSNFLIKKL